MTNGDATLEAAARSRLSDSWRDWGAAALTASTGFGYALGLGGVALFSRKLDVAPSDLDLTTADYLFFAAGGVLLWAVLAAVYLATSSLNDHAVPITDLRAAIRLRETHGRWMAAKDVLKSIMFFLFGTAAQTVLMLVAFAIAILTGIDVFVGLAAIGLLSVLLWRARRNPRLLAMAVAAFALIASVMVLTTASRWGGEIRAYARGDTERLTARWPFAAIVSPERGQAVVDGRSWCVVRVSERVFAGRSYVVVTNIDAFHATSCDVDAEPFAP